MTVVLVHGVPETAAIWEPLLAELAREDAVTLSPPGFGAAVPTGFEATSDAYRDWLVGELETMDGPVDLVGHDWGGGHALRAATARPDLVRRLATDIAGISDPSYRWHDTAQIWQSDEGEAFVESIAALPLDQRTEMLVGAGMSPDAAAECAAANDARMGDCILRLYRSALQPEPTRWGDAYAASAHRPATLVIAPTDDHYTGGVEMAQRVARRWNAEVAELEGLGHWWMLQDAVRGAAVLREFLE